MKKNEVYGRSVPINFNPLFRVMKLCLLFTVMLNLSVVAATNAQLKKVSLIMENAELRQVFKKIKQQTGVRFFYNEEKLKNIGNRRIEIHDLELEKALDEILEGTELTYTFLRDVVVIKDRENSREVLETLMQQKRLIRGIVKDEKGITLPGVSVIVKGTQTGVATDINGRFEIKVDDEPNLILQFSFVGMKTKEIKIGNNQELKVVLESAAESLDEVIVTGYQTISKERTTGSFGVITPRNIETKLQSNLSSVLEGQATGVVLDKDGKIEIRGVSTFNAENEPLVVLDGYPIEGGLESINPENIENITVLKDGVAASIYGSRAANGVIVVTTTRGAADRFNVSYKAIVSTILKPQLSKLNRASTSDYIDAELDLYYQNPNRPSTQSVSNMSKVTWLMMQAREGNMTEAEALAEIDKLRNINGLKQAEKYFYRNQLSHQHNIAINGGTEKNRFNAAVNYMYNRGNMIHSDNSRLIFDLKNDWKPSKYISLGLMANVVYTKDEHPVRGWSDLLGYTNTSLIQPYDNLVDPETGKPTTVFSTSTYKIANYEKIANMKDWSYNPIEDVGKETTDTEDIQTRLGGTLKIYIIDGLNIETGGIWTRGNKVEKTTYDRDAYRIRIQYNDATSKTNNASHYFPDGAMIDEWRNINESWTLRTQINFNRSFLNDRHRVTFLAGNEVRKSTYSNNQYATRLGYNPTAGSFIPVNIKDWNSGLNKADMLFGSTTVYSLKNGAYNLRDNRFVSWYGNGSYEFDSRYLVSGSVRLDLTNFFGTDSKYRYKPLWSVGATWKLAEEKFFSVSWIDRLNLRASYGINGNISLSEGPYLMLAAGSYQEMTGGVSYSIASPPNNQLRWEKTKTTNIGADIALFDNRINLTFDYYLKNSSDLLARDAIDPTTGFSSLTKNVGEMQNNGVEFSVNADIIKKQDFVWNSVFNFSYNKNKVKTYNVTRMYTSQWASMAPILAEGYPADAMFGFKYAGLNDKGEALGYSANGEKDRLANLTTDDIIYLGTVRPKYDLSFTNAFKYKNIQLSFMFIAKLGHQYRKDGFYGMNYQNRHVADRWQKPGDEATKKYPQLRSGSTEHWYFPYTDFLTGNASYMKLRDVTLAYTFPKHWLSSVGVNNVRAYFQARNIWTVTAKGTDIDPETAQVNMTGAYNNFTEQGFTSLPLRPEFYFGLSFSF